MYSLWGSVPQSNRPTCFRMSHLSLTKMIPNRGRMPTLLDPPYLSSAEGDFQTPSCRGQLHLEWVFRSALEGVLNVALKSNTRVHPLHLPRVLLTP